MSDGNYDILLQRSKEKPIMNHKRMLTLIAIIAVISSGMTYIYHMNGDSLDLSDSGFYIIVTDSMEPTIEKNSLIFINYTDDFQIGDIAGYRTSMSGSLFFHRIISIDEGMIQLKGDAYEFIDTVPKEQVLCKVTGIDPYLGKLITSVQSNLLLIIIGIFMLIGVYQTSYIIFSQKEENNEKQ